MSHNNNFLQTDMLMKVAISQTNIHSDELKKERDPKYLTNQTSKASVRNHTYRKMYS